MYRTVKFLIVLHFLNFVACEQTTQPCLPQRYSNDRMVCVCSGEYCDTLDIPPITAKSEYILVTTSLAGDRFNFIRGKFSTAVHYAKVKPLKPFNLNSTYIQINEISNGRSFTGMGGTYTGSTAYLVDKMTASLQDNFYTSFYSIEFGSGFSKIRLPIGGTANDLNVWTYADNDPNFSNLSITNAEDDSRVEQLLDILAAYDGDNLEFIAYPSTAPRWMKQTATYVGSSVRPEFYQKWADYLVEYLKLMRNRGINITGLSTGERPHTSSRVDQNAPSMAWNPIEQGKWLAEFLGPTMNKTSGFSNVKIQAYDDDRSKILLWISLMSLGNVNALKYIDTINIQGYKDKRFPAGLIDLSYAKFYGKSIYSSEMSFAGPPILGSWQRAEEYIENICENLKHDTQAYLLLNMLIDQRGGPSLNDSQSFDAPIVVSNDFTHFYRQPSFYVISHFSRFILPGSVRLDVSVIGINSNMPVLAFLRPDGRVVVFIYNSSNGIAPVVMSDRYQGTIDINLKPKSINTIIY